MKYRVVGTITSDEASYMKWDTEHKLFPTYRIIDKVDLGIHDFDSLDDAELWLLNNHPENYFGANIVSTENSDFMCIATKEYFMYNEEGEIEFTAEEVIESQKKHLTALLCNKN